MSRLSKQQIKAHNQADLLLQKDKLTDDDRFFILENWHEGSNQNPTETGAFFTPPMLARDFALDAYSSGKVLDICAGIGALSLFVSWRVRYETPINITCIELNPRFVEIGKKMLPDANWICADAFDLPDLQLGHFDSVISNPPYGKASRTKNIGKCRRYRGSDFEFQLIDLVADHADYGTFLIPQQSAPFSFSGRQGYRTGMSAKVTEFIKQTGFEMEAGCGVDTAIHRDDWKSTNIITEIVTVDFKDWRDQNTERQAAATHRLSHLKPTNSAEQIALF